MDIDNEKKFGESTSADYTAGNREGYQSSGQSGNYQNYRPAAGRSPRPRIHAQRAYSERSNYNRPAQEEGGFRPEGFGAGLQSGAPQRPSYSNRFNNGEGGYSNRGGYNNQRGSYGSNRGGYNNNRGG